jgi:hypothetical protein
MVSRAKSLLVGARAPAVAIPAQRPPLYEPAFGVADTGVLKVGVDHLHEDSSYFSHAVARSPGDLRLHVVRINLHLQAENAEALWGALVDLFLVLQAKGFAIRQRMLLQARRLLDQNRYRLLHSSLANGLRDCAEIPSAPESVMRSGRGGGPPLVVKRVPNHSEERDPLADAQDHIQYGQIPQAQAVLEGALRADPLRRELHHELLAIYRSTRDKTAFLVTYNALPLDLNPVPDAWERVAEHLGCGS